MPRKDPRLVPDGKMDEAQDSWIKDATNEVKQGHAALIVTFDGRKIRHSFITNKVENIDLDVMGYMVASALNAMADCVKAVQPEQDINQVTHAVLHGAIATLLGQGRLKRPPSSTAMLGVQ